MGCRIGDRYLVGAECALDLSSVNDPGSCPSLRGIENDHPPARAGGVSIDARILLNALDLFDVSSVAAIVSCIRAGS